MVDAWEVYPTQVHEHAAVVSYNKGYAEIARTDSRNTLLTVKATLKAPRPDGMPTNQEFAALNQIEDNLNNAVERTGGVEVGRLTTNGQRLFSFYVTMPEAVASHLVAAASTGTSYSLGYSFKADSQKDGYWKALYPGPDDREVIKDLSVLESLRKGGDVAETVREVDHFVYFHAPASARQFGAWATARGYDKVKVGPSPTDDLTGVRFAHRGTALLEDIKRHTVEIARKAAELGGDYDGWETSIERPTR